MPLTFYHRIVQLTSHHATSLGHGVLELPRLCGDEEEKQTGVWGFFCQLESRVERKTVWLFRFFGRRQEKKNIAQHCDYDDPNKIKFCPPVQVRNPRLAANHNPNLPYAGPKNSEAFPSKCLEDPDDSDCRRLTGTDVNSMSSSRPGAQAATVAESNGASHCLQGGVIKILSVDSTVRLPAGAVEVVSVEKDSSLVTFQITQQWKSSGVGWVQPAYKKGGNTCDLTDRLSAADGGFALQFTAECLGGKASLDLYVQDSTFVGASASNFHDCAEWSSAGVAFYSLELACNGSDLCEISAEQNVIPTIAPTTLTPHLFTATAPIGALTTSSPSKDMCYGNMLKNNGKFCHSEMPSVSAEPSEQPTGFNPDFEGQEERPFSDAPSDVPSQAPTDLSSDAPSDVPSQTPTDLSSDAPSDVPSQTPTDLLSDAPSDVPSQTPTDLLSDAPSDVPSQTPTDLSSDAPSDVP
ncbi:MAG: hypothetical protein SGBAC_009240, partial [Bacillariaceae sp.]